VQWSPALFVGLVVVSLLAFARNSALVELGLLLLAAKLMLSARRRREIVRPDVADARSLRVTVVVPLYNEDPAIIRQTIRSLRAQTRIPDRIHVVDDGSRSSEAIETVQRETAGMGECVRISRHARNRGKRAAIATAVRGDADTDIFVTVDSDTVLDPGAIEALLTAFADRTVLGATALVRVLNNRRNLLTRLIDLRYANAFLLDRGFQSAFGSVLCACGSLAAWRRRVLVDNLDDFENQCFLGQRCTYGDDRRLTNYALRAGRVVLVPEAIARTAAPEQLGHYIRQQVRWSRSFIRESLWAVMNLSITRIPFWLSLAELATWVAFTATIAVLIVVAPFTSAVFGATTLLAYVMIAAIMSWLRSIRWFDAALTGESRRERLATFLIAPLYAVLHIFILLPLRFVALATLRTTSWGTRGKVEVTIAVDSEDDGILAPISWHTA
jgi:hyaluronan synthase